MKEVLDKMDPAWRGGDLYYKAAAEVNGDYELGMKIGDKHWVLVMDETILRILNGRGLDPDNELVKSDVSYWKERFGNKKPQEIVEEVRRQLEESNR